MIDFEPTKEQLAIVKMTRDFIKKELTPEVIKEHERNHKRPTEIIKKMAKIGLTSVTVPREYGGAGLDWITHGMLCEEIGGAWFSMSLLVLMKHVGLVSMPILWFGTDEQKKKYLPRLAKGEITGCVAAVEPNTGSDATAIETMATLDGDSWVINGSKTWITDAVDSDFLEILCQTDKTKGAKGLALIFVDKDTPGMTIDVIQHKTGCYSAPTCEIKFNNCRVPKENLLGEIGRGFQISASGIANARYSLSATATGIIQNCIDTCVKYSQERSQFGRQIGSFQLIQETISNMVVARDASRYLYYHVGHLKNKQLPFDCETSVAKLYNTEAAFQACAKAVQIHGAYGYCDEIPAERHMRDVMSGLIFGGTNEMHKLIIGRTLTGLNAFK